MSKQIECTKRIAELEAQLAESRSLASEQQELRIAAVVAFNAGFATALKERDEALANAKKYLHWANCGGAPTGRFCTADARDRHEIYGPGMGDSPENYVCELHFYRAEIASLRLQDLATRTFTRA